MVGPDADERGSVWEGIWASMPRISVLLAALGVLYSCLLFLTGGVRPQSQIDIDRLKDTVAEMSKTLASYQSKVDALPRGSDFQGWEGHFSRLDAVYEAQRDTVTQSKFDIKDLAAKVTDLTARYQALTATGPGRK